MPACDGDEVFSGRFVLTGVTVVSSLCKTAAALRMKDEVRGSEVNSEILGTLFGLGTSSIRVLLSSLLGELIALRFSKILLE